MQKHAESRAKAADVFWDDPITHLSRLYAPVSLPGGGIAVATADSSSANGAWLKARYGDAAILECPPPLVQSLIEKRFRDRFAKMAVSDLREHEPQFSASTVITRPQIFALLLIAAAIAFASGWWAGAITDVICFLFAANNLFRALLFCISSIGTPQKRIAASSDEELPLYTILVPLYREARVLPALVRALCALDYPKDRLDIKLIVEADDDETARVADAAAIDPRFSIVRVPPGSPRTKPRACNYALPFARGEFTVIFDAEDRPEPDQLRKAVAAFRALPSDVACLQARLNFYNANECWLTRMFALDYALWFDYLLPGLDRLNIPMPLGGTSNHFRTSALRAIHGWDPYNVTEDADLGIRLARQGLRVRVLDSTTFEEATNSLGPWLRQRSRWIKGYMQTWLVHMRSPRALLRNAGAAGFAGFQFFVAGAFLSALLNPVLWGFFVLSQFAAPAPSDHAIAQASLFGLVLGNSLFAYLAVLSPARRRWFGLAPYGLTAPFYWLLISCAGIRALFQLCSRPWYWDKTPHGLSRTEGGA
ncbi:MAG TPA: glycosyltransferase [Rhizomicrobium sp.]|nr:glycosyltransferase [Rhizomicrobium sp.]